jgi:hypothetical protein
MSDAGIPLPGAIRVTIDYALEYHDDGRIIVRDPDGYGLNCDSIEEALADVRTMIAGAYSSGRFQVEATQRPRLLLQ